MSNRIYEEVYRDILEDAQKVRRNVMNEWGDILMFGGTMPQEVVDDLTVVARITGLVFDALGKHGIKMSPAGNKNDIYEVVVGGTKYVCHATAIPSLSGFLEVVNVPGVQQSNPVTRPTSTVSEEKKWTRTSIEQPKVSNEHSWEVNKEDYRQYSEANEPEENEAENANAEPYKEEPAPVQNPEPVEPSEFDEPKTEADTKNSFSSFNDMNEAAIFGESQQEEDGPSIGMIDLSSLFIEEKRKHIDQIVYDTYDLTLSHAGTGGQPLELTVTIAPLKISKYVSMSIPILVAVYNTKTRKIIMASSYDAKDDAKNLVSMEIDDFSLLFRGAFVADGSFESYVSPAGISASQGDVLNINSKTKYGQPISSNVNNGHVKFSTPLYDEENGTVEAVPFGDPDDNEFVVLTKTEEFVDYLFVSDSKVGGVKAMLYVGDERKNVVCKWEGDYMTVELKDM